MKRINILLAVVLACAIGLFCAYLFWIHNNLDTTSPVITVSEELLEISVTDPQDALFQGITALDDRDGDVTASLLVESISGITDDNVTTVTYAAFDRAGNVGKIIRKVRYHDYEAPRFSLSGPLAFPVGSSFDVLDYIGAEDVLEGDIRRRIHATLISDTKSINQMGTHVVRFQVTNSLGDTVEIDLPVEVYDSEWYSAGVELDEYMIYLDVGDSFDPEDYLSCFIVRGNEIEIGTEVPDNIYCEITNRVNTRIPGVYEVTYFLSQNVNMEVFSGQASLIVIVQE